MKPIAKLLTILVFFFQYSNAYAPLNPTECSLSRYKGDAKCVKLAYDEINERLSRTYKNILENIPRYKEIEVIQEYMSLLKSKNEICAKNPRNNMKAICEEDYVFQYYDNTERDCEIAKDDFCDFYKYYGDIFESISGYNASVITKSYNSWLKSKDDFCKKYSGDEIKLKSCHIDYIIPKLNEFWGIESILLERPFEGKWASCGYRQGNFTCGTYFTMEQGDNVCNGDWYRENPDDYYISIRLYEKEGNYVYPVKSCYTKDANSDYIGCDILEDGYDEQGRKLYKTSVPFSDWEDDHDDKWRRKQSLWKEPYLSTNVKTPFLQGEREELIQTNKWLKDCLNY
ncbi:MAG: hypothetical protein LBJ88_04810 [Campylobacteraceae bacterium]|jgi:hypothetical protein|nr:hypothetical protein [Campylobacteraceae bacterium]